MQKLLLTAISLFCCAVLHAQGYEITVKMKDYKQGTLYLGHYMGKSTYLMDSTQIGPNGVAVLKGKEKTPGGIYLVVMPGRQRYFEMLLDKQQTFSMTVDTANLMTGTVYMGSPDNDLFLSYNKFLSAMEPENRELQRLLQQKTKADTAKAVPLQAELFKRINTKREEIVTQHPKALLTSIFKLMKEPEVPQTLPKKADGTADSTFPYRYYKAHYWDNTDLADGRLVRTPIYEGKLQKYFSQLVVPEADSVNAEADRLLAKTRADKEMFKFTLWWLTNTYETSPYMGMDAVFVHLVEKYYVPGDATWLTEEQKNKIIARAYTIAPNLIGQPAPPLVMEDSTGKPVSLYNVKGKYTVLVFWDPTCSHCKTEIPRIDSAYKALWKNQGIAVMGVKTEGTKEEWSAFIHKNKLTGWVHALDAQQKTNYRRLYDVYSTPVIYLLDEKKKIIAKRLGVEQLIGFLQHLDKQTTSNTTR
ncbi:DUF5106 domain-containing protein [Chitinophaga horti]|uniref:DUF5106 domain-containing protein n=1 Tax=Chitinophaga horti TaxID=2920382 RepID=A0ABY6IZV1_9BACT|nr:TlpA family protein disulfide reductase [Chitinophaga horti]UYQ92944.1 DUF5106 domain-containing protein [Chitinophaga horti]